MNPVFRRATDDREQRLIRPKAAVVSSDNIDSWSSTLWTDCAPSSWSWRKRRHAFRSWSRTPPSSEDRQRLCTPGIGRPSTMTTRSEERRVGKEQRAGEALQDEEDNAEEKGRSEIHCKRGQRK